MSSAQAIEFFVVAVNFEGARKKAKELSEFKIKKSEKADFTG